MDGSKIRNKLKERAVDLVDKAGRTGGACLEEGRRAARKAADSLKDTLRKQKETPEIIDRASKRMQEAVARYEAERESGRETAARLDRLEQELIEDEFARFGRLYENAVNRTLCLREEKREEELVLEMPVPEREEHISAGLRGAAAGGMTAASMVALTAAFGTTAAGTAIAGLSGSAFIGATLAALGGGAVAGGGFGIVGGMAVVGGAFAIPAVAAGMHFWQKDVEKDYDNALRYEEKVDAAVTEIDARRRGLREAGRFAQSLFHDLWVQRTALDSMLDIFERSLTVGRTREAFEICAEAIGWMGKSIRIEYDTGKTPSDRASWSELELAALAFGRVQERFGAYVASFEEAGRKEAEAVFSAREERLRQELKAPVRKPLKNEEIRKLLEDTFLKFAQEEICLIVPWVTNWAVFDLVGEALSRGVAVRILYGIKDDDSGKDAGKKNAGSMSKKNLWTQQNIADMKKRFARYGDLFRAKKTNTHAKLLIADDKYYFIGSYNLFSFRGEYETSDNLREEIGDYAEDPQMIKFYKRRYFEF